MTSDRGQVSAIELHSLWRVSLSSKSFSLLIAKQCMKPHKVEIERSDRRRARIRKIYRLTWSFLYGYLTASFLKALLWSLYALALFLIIGRVQSRIAIREGLKIDKYFSILSFVLLIVQTVLHTLTIPTYLEAQSVFHSNSNAAGTWATNPFLENNVSTMLCYSFVGSNAMISHGIF
jgi:hypothetical protein